MRVTVADSYGDIHNLEVNDDMDLDSFKALLATQLSQPKETILLFFNNLELRENKPLKELGIKDNDLLAFTTANNTKASLSTSDNRLSVTEQQFLNEIEALRNNLITNPRALENLKREQPELHDAVLKGPADFAAAYSKFEMHRSQLQLQKNQELAKLRDDPFNVEAQMKIESLIKEQNIMANMQNALEHNPESFAQVHMLYINTEVNGFPVKALVDSGAQSTIMNPTCAESCGILRLLDTRFAGVAMGAGTAKILGRIHSAPLKIGKEFYPCSFTVMEAKGVDLLLGLDMLKRYQATLNHQIINDLRPP